MSVKNMSNGWDTLLCHANVRHSTKYKLKYKAEECGCEKVVGAYS